MGETVPKPTGKFVIENKQNTEEEGVMTTAVLGKKALERFRTS